MPDEIMEAPPQQMSPEEQQMMQAQQKAMAERERYLKLQKLNSVELNNIALVLDNEERGFSFKSMYQKDQEISGKDFLKEIGRVVVEDFEFDLNSRSEWEDKTKRAIQLFGSLMPRKTTPWPDASNINLPFISIACTQFHARAIDALLPAKGLVNVLNVSEEDTEKAERVRKFMNYDLLYRMEGFEEGVDKSMMQLPLIGSVFRKTIYDPTTKINKSMYVSALDIVVDYNARSETDPRMTHIMRFSKDQMRKRASVGVFHPKVWDYDQGTKGTVLNDSGLEEAARDLEGRDEAAMHTRDNPRYVIEQHRWLDLNGDGLDEPYIVTVDLETEDVLRIVSRTLVDARGKTFTMNHFTHYQFLPSPEGFYGIGYGLLLLGLNEGANTIVNEVVDAGALANNVGGFVSRRAGIKGGSISFKMGEFKEIDTYAEDVSKAILPMNFSGPDQTLYSTLGLLYEYAKLVSSVSEISTGQLPASDTPAHTVLALIEEGKKVYNAIHRRIHRSFKRELKKIFHLNSVYLDEEYYFKVLGDSGVPVGPMEVVGAQDFVDSLDVFPVSDPNIASVGEKATRAKEAYDVILSNPLTAQNQNSVATVTITYLEALGVERVKQLVQPPPPPPDLHPAEENANILKLQPVHVLPNQDHMFHLEVLDELESGAYADQVPPEGKRMIEQHKMEHVSAMYLMEKQQEAQIEQGGE